MMKPLFSEMDAQFAQRLLQEYTSPLFVIDGDGILARFAEFSDAAKSLYPKAVISISYKTNFLRGLLAKLHQAGAWAEVVSGPEYEMAKFLGVPAQQIIFNGPMKTEQELRTAIQDGAYIHCDHFEEIQRIEALVRSDFPGKKIPVGLRLGLSQIGKQWNRFGFPLDETSHPHHAMFIAQYVHESDVLTMAGVHAHIGTDIRDFDAFKQLAMCMSQFCWDIHKKLGITLAWLDVGGGLAGISPLLAETDIAQHPLPALAAYLQAVITPLRSYLDASGAALFFEPGRTLFEPYAGLLTEVVGVRPAPNDDLPSLIMNAAFTMFPSVLFYNHPIRHFKNEDQQQSITYRFYGPSCDQDDVLRQPTELPKMQRGDFLLFLGIGAYSMSFAIPSFIRYRPGVVWWDKDGIEWLRQPENLAYHGAMESVSRRNDS